jgi:hypothetical protein
MGNESSDGGIDVLEDKLVTVLVISFETGDGDGGAVEVLRDANIVG